MKFPINNIKRSISRYAAIGILCLFSTTSAYSANLLSFMNLEATCLDLKVGGYCPFTDKLILMHKIPVALIEVNRSPGDVFFSPVAEPNIATRTQRNNKQFGFSVRIWDISKAAHKIMSACVLCDPNNNSMSTGETPSMDGMSDIAGSMGAIGESLNGAFDMCGAGASELTDLFSEGFSMGWIKLVYDTTADFLHWRTGCRDTAKAANVAEHLQCAASGMARGVDDLASVGGVDSDLSGGLGLGGNEECLGTWGLIYPRQYRSYGSEIQAAAFTAWRALHLARNDIESLDHEVVKSNLLQHAWPMVSTCFKPGASALKLESQTVASKNGNYAFVYWKEIACCRGMSDISECWSDMGQDSSGGSQNMESGMGSGGP